MTILLVIILSVPMGLFLLYIIVGKVVEGYEDETGFHYGSDLTSEINLHEHESKLSGNE
jgi:hypothetical protein